MAFKTYFSENPLERADHLRGDENWLKSRLNAENSRFLLMRDLKPFMQVNPHMAPYWVGQDHAAPLLAQGAESVFLGLQNDTAYFAITVDADFETGLDGKWIDLRSIGISIAHDPFLGILAQARSLLAWRKRRSYCSNCGHKNKTQHAGYILKCSNEACAAQHFPRTDPVVIMLVIKDDACLLGRGRHFPPKQFSALAGFMEPGENIEEAVRREILEETNVQTGDVHYVASQPWPFPSTLMIGCIAQALTTQVTIDPIELEDAIWVTKDAVKSTLNGAEGPFHIPPPLAIARQLLDHWVQD